MPIARQPRMTAEERRWRAENDLGTLEQAEEIKKDKTRLAAARAAAKRKLAALSKVTRATAPKRGAKKRR